MNKILIIHPDDRSTDFLKPIYQPLLKENKNTTLITGGITKDEVRKLIEQHDQIIMLGHGSPNGLYAIDEFDTRGSYIVDETMVAALGNKPNIYIWCNADRFVDRYYLKGLYSGMFISEVAEANYERVYDITQEVVDESNNEFSKLMGNFIFNYVLHSIQPLYELFHLVKDRYSLLAESNKVAKYNAERLYLKQ